MAIDIRGLAPLPEVFDMPARIHFYCDVLGFDLVSTSGPGDHFGWAAQAQWRGVNAQHRL
jgi:catechol 2,3-dioxygenase-like lactoylglutathione lyase family enzyme